MSKNELIDQISSSLFKQKGRTESRKSYFKIRDYLEQLDINQLKIMYEEIF